MGWCGSERRVRCGKYSAVLYSNHENRDRSKEADKVLQKMRRTKAGDSQQDQSYARGERVDIMEACRIGLLQIRVGQDSILDDMGVIVFIVEVGPRGGIYKE